MKTDKTHSPATAGTETASARPENVRFHTVSATIRGALCGHIWMPQVKDLVDADTYSYDFNETD